MYRASREIFAKNFFQIVFKANEPAGASNDEQELEEDRVQNVIDIEGDELMFNIPGSFGDADDQSDDQASNDDTKEQEKDDYTQNTDGCFLTPIKANTDDEDDCSQAY